MTQCIDQFGGLVWSLARRYCAGIDDADDIVQDIFTEIWQSAARYNPQVGSEATFIALIARRRCIDFHRRQSRKPKLDSLDEAISSTSTPASIDAELSDDAQQATRALESLQPQQREALRLAIYEDCSHSEIAKKLDIPIGTVKTNVRRGLERVRQLLR